MGRTLSRAPIFTRLHRKGYSRYTFTNSHGTGQQSVEILREAGCSEQEIRGLIETGATLDGSLRDAVKKK